MIVGRRLPRPLPAVAISAVVAVAACSSSGPTERAADVPGGVDSPTELSTFDLRPGDCLVAPDDIQAKLGSIDAVPCDDPHDFEVFALADYDDSDTFPGEDELNDFADGQCITDFLGYTGDDYLDSELFVTYLLPTIESWNSADRTDRTAVCLLTDPSRQRSSSAAAE